MPRLPEYFISCDWGTSVFRLRVVASTGLQVLGASVSDRGIGRLSTGGEGASPAIAPLRYLREQLDALDVVCHGAPVVVSGMATSSLGIRELEYATLPLDVNGNSLPYAWVNGANHPLLLVSGVRDVEDVMRGEETLAIGVADLLEEDGVLILPGTHCKHLYYYGGAFTGFRTYMTGELFTLLAWQSILAASVVATPLDGSLEAFHRGVETGSQGGLSGGLFAVRARAILQKEGPESGYHYLSGLLIGDELSHVRKDGLLLYLAATGPLWQAYGEALRLLFSPGRYRIFEEPFTVRALLLGQRKLLARALK